MRIMEAVWPVTGLYFGPVAVAPMRGLSLRKGLIEAAKADVASLTAFEVGLFGWMALMYLVFFPAPHHLAPASPVYWFLMQAGMIAGFLTAWPAGNGHRGPVAAWSLLAASRRLELNRRTMYM